MPGVTRKQLINMLVEASHHLDFAVELWGHGWFGGQDALIRIDHLIAQAKTEELAQSDEAGAGLTVWYGSMPESNGKANWTAILQRKGDGLFDGPHFTIDRSEYPDRVRYEADCVRYLIGELIEEPCIMDYDGQLHSGYVSQVSPAEAPVKDKAVCGTCDGNGAVGTILTAEPCPDCCYSANPLSANIASDGERLHPLQQCLRDNGEKIAADATIAQLNTQVEQLQSEVEELRVETANLLGDIAQIEVERDIQIERAEAAERKLEILRPVVSEFAGFFSSDEDRYWQLHELANI